MQIHELVDRLKKVPGNTCTIELIYSHMDNLTEPNPSWVGIAACMVIMAGKKEALED